MKNKIIVIQLLVLLRSFSFAQMETYDYKRELHGVNDTWHAVTLPDIMFSKIAADFSDIRIYGVSKNMETLEVPYILKVAEEQSVTREVGFTLINKSRNKNGFYFTFEVPSKKALNSIKLNFRQENFDYRLNLEGSHNLLEWYTITENYRIMSIKNELTNYRFTTVTFPNSRYRYFRVLILLSKNDEIPDLLSATMRRNEIIKGESKSYPAKSINIKQDRDAKKTVINVELNLPVPVSKLTINIKDTFDYYRPITIQYMADSFKTEKGWKYKYLTLLSTTLSSLEKHEFKFQSTILKKLRIIINNHDNTPLYVGRIEIKGNIYQLIARFTRPADYFLTYGSNKSVHPQYDINRFMDSIPEGLSELSMGNEQKINKEEMSEARPLFQSKAWLWGIIILIISLLGWFSFKMIRQK